MSAPTPWSVYLGKQTPVEQEPDTGQTFVLPDALRDGGHVESSFLRRIIDWDALDYLSGTIRDLMPKQSKLAQASYVPLKATGRPPSCQNLCGFVFRHSFVLQVMATACCTPSLAPSGALSPIMKLFAVKWKWSSSLIWIGMLVLRESWLGIFFLKAASGTRLPQTLNPWTGRTPSRHVLRLAVECLLLA
jgi:hypothetical protein